MEGWISLHRKITEHWVWQNDKYLKAWMWFLIRANHKPNKILIGSELTKLNKGEFITSIYNTVISLDIDIINNFISYITIKGYFRLPL